MEIEDGYGFNCTKCGYAMENHTGKTITVIHHEQDCLTQIRKRQEMMKQTPPQPTLEQIRKRESYRYWGELYNWLQDPRTPEELIYKIHEIVDRYRGFHSETNSGCAMESIELLIQEKQDKR